MSPKPPAAPVWAQEVVRLPHKARGCHLVTHELLTPALTAALRPVRVGLAHVFIQHTSASLTISENADPDVLRDMQLFLERIVPDADECDLPLRHVAEGADDMSAHVKAALTSTSLTIPVRDGRLALGTWQGVWLLEHRVHGGARNVVVTVQGAGA